MITHKFDVKLGNPTDHLINRINKIQSSNGLFQAMFHAYSYHLPLWISPDDVANNICCIWSKYIFLNAEKFRSFFVEHAGKKELTYLTGGMYSEGRIPELIDGLSDLVKNDQKNDNLAWMDYSSSVSMPTDRLIRSTAKLASQKAYYKYKAVLCCGFSEIILAGTPDDWIRLANLISSLPTPDDRLKVWKDDLYTALEGMVIGKEDFWQTAISKQFYGSGSQTTISGWGTVFNPINENGEWTTEIDDSDILNLTVDFDIHINDNGNEFDVNVSAGPTSCVYDDKIATKNFFQIVEK